MEIAKCQSIHVHWDMGLLMGLLVGWDDDNGKDFKVPAIKIGVFVPIFCLLQFAA